jgi:hypothetical protein
MGSGSTGSAGGTFLARVSPGAGERRVRSVPARNAAMRTFSSQTARLIRAPIV